MIKIDSDSIEIGDFVKAVYSADPRVQTIGSVTEIEIIVNQNRKNIIIDNTNTDSNLRYYYAWPKTSIGKILYV